MPPPPNPKIYHIVHVDRLPSIIAASRLWCDSEIVKLAAINPSMGTMIGMNSIKQRRLNELTLSSHSGLHVGECVPFYFCPRSVMLYLIHKANHPELDFRGGQGEIVHLEADLRETVGWADRKLRRWAFTLSNAGSDYFEDLCDLEQLSEVDWDAVQTRNWSQCKEQKQAELLVERSFPWKLVERIGVASGQAFARVASTLQAADYRPPIEYKPEWYY